MILVIAIGFSLTGNLMAQKDSVQLSEVVVKGFVPERFMSGLKIQKMDSATLLTYRFQNIADLLSFNTPIAFKNYGPGQLNTPSFRGTSANHTAVLWNGLNINSPTLGQTDFSTIPVVGFDQLSVQYGSAASIVGSDAVGGSILLGSLAQLPGVHLTVGRQQESFSNSQTQITARYGESLGADRSISGKTVGYLGKMANHFPYTERRGYYVLPSKTFQTGFMQDVFFQPKANQQLSAHVWVTNNELTLNPENTSGRELTKTASYRTMLRYQFNDWIFRASWVRDILDYATGDFSNLDHAITDRFTGRVERAFQYNLGGNGAVLNVSAGGEWSLYRTQVAGYEKPVITENREDIFMLTRLQATQRWLVSINLRQAFVTKFSPPLTPSLGTEYNLIKNQVFNMKFRGSIARSYRVPTLNERYWKTLGNSDIKPENGLNKELGFDAVYRFDNLNTVTGSITGYHNRVHNWTYWNPAKNYHVENIQQVLAKGIELQLGWNYQNASWKMGAKTGYALTRSVQEKAYDSYSEDIIGKQLVYVPIQNANFNAFISFKRTRLSTQIMGVSRRYNTFDNSTFLEGYSLTNILAETTVPIQKITIRVQGQVNNLANTFYLNVRNNAMPGRSFAVNLLFGYDER